MKAIDGIVIDNQRLRLRGGAILPAPPGLRFGQQIKICWDHTKGCVYEVIQADKCWENCEQVDDGEEEDEVNEDDYDFDMLYE
jgi:hypothetical protein